VLYASACKSEQGVASHAPTVYSTCLRIRWLDKRSSRKKTAAWGRAPITRTNSNKRRSRCGQSGSTISSSTPSSPPAACHPVKLHSPHSNLQWDPSHLMIAGLSYRTVDSRGSLDAVGQSQKRLPDRADEEEQMMTGHQRRRARCGAMR
jgi:hypothetical protein